MRVEITTDAAGASGSGWPATTYLMSYQSIEDFLPLAKKHGAPHRERSRLFHSRGTLLMAGPLGEPMNGDAIGLFTTREAAEESSPGTRSCSTAWWPGGRSGRGPASSRAEA